MNEKEKHKLRRLIRDADKHRVWLLLNGFICQSISALITSEIDKKIMVYNRAIIPSKRKEATQKKVKRPVAKYSNKSYHH